MSGFSLAGAPAFFFMTKRPTRRVLLLGWDAADWNLIRPLMEAGKMPVLQKLVESGVSGPLTTLQPVISPILWNSIATGKRADKHDILGFVEPTPDGSGVRPVTSTSRKAKALWNILSQCGRRSVVVNWYASHPAEPVAGTILSDRFTAVVGANNQRSPLPPSAAHPPEALELAESFRVHPSEITLPQLLAFFPGTKPTSLEDPRLGMLATILAQCATTQNAAVHFAQEEDWDLLAVYYDAIDHAGHCFMEYHPPAMAHVGAEDAALFGGVMENVYRFHDLLLGRLLDLVGPETSVLLLSDHGFHHDELRPRVAEHTTDPRKKFSNEMNPVAWHRLHGVFVAAGQGIKRDELFYGTSLLDIAPTVLALLGLPVPEDMDGKVLADIFTEPSAVERIASYEPPHPDDGTHRGVAAEETDPWTAQAALEQLAALGYVELPTGDDGDAAREAVARSREDRLNNLAQVYFSSNRPAQALEILRERLTLKNGPHLRCRIALCLLELNRTDEAAETMAAIPPAWRNNPLVRLILGQIALVQNRIDEALSWLEPLEKEDFPKSHLHTILGQAYLRRGLYKNADAAFRRAIDRDDNNAEAHDGLGVALRRQGFYEDAVYEHTRAAALQHHRAQTHLNLGIALTMSHQFDWAIRAFTLAAEMKPLDPTPHRYLAQLYRRVKKDDERVRQHLTQFVELRRRLRAEVEQALAKAGTEARPEVTPAASAAS